MKILKKIKTLIPPLHQWEGKKTSLLVRNPSTFGLGQTPEKQTPDATTTIVCGFCSTGCGLNIHLKNNHSVNLTPDSSYPVNLGMACPKGWAALDPLKADDRATSPMIRTTRGGELEETTWQNAMDLFCEKFKTIQKNHGQDSVAFISTGQIVTEEMTYLGALAKFGMGIKHGDGNTRQCMATAVVAYKQSFGFDAPPYTYQDFEESDTIVLIGSNLCIAHPIMWQRIERNKHQPEIIVIDPRKTETAVAATQHHQILPKSDLVFLYGIAHLLIKNNWVDHTFIENHTDEYEAFAKHVEKFTPEMVAKQAGVTPESIHQLAETIHQGKRVSLWWTMGVNQGHEATRTAQAIINIALITGNIGRPGTGANSITGQCNAMGSRLFSNTTGLLGGYDFASSEDRKKVANILEIDESTIPTEPSLAYDQIIDAIHDGKIKGLWVLATNGAHSWIHQEQYKSAMDKLDYLVVQDMYTTTETVDHADLLLPAAGWGEKDGTFINSERRIGLVKKVHTAPGLALSDFNIFKLIAEHWGCSEMFRKWQMPEDVFQIMAKLSAGQPCDFTGITDYQLLDTHGGIQWPYTGEANLTKNNQRHLFENKEFYHANKRAKLIFAEPTPVAEDTTAEFPLILLTGRGTSAQWHTQTRTKKSAILRKLYPESIYLEINPEDAKERSIKPNQMVEITSPRATIMASAYITTSVKAGQCFMPMHYAKANQLTQASFDPHSRQPSYKYCAININPK